MRLTADELKSRITANPTNTILKSQDTETEKYFKICKIIPKHLLDLPDSFNGKEVWKDLLSPVIDQGRCGSCWAFASTSVLADKFNIQSYGQLQLQLSPTKLIICGKDFESKFAVINIKKQIELEFLSENQNFDIYNIENIQNYSCYGNSLYNAFQYLYLFGTCTEQCIPYNKNLGVQKEYQKIGDFSSAEQLPLCSYISGPVGDMCSDFFISSNTGVEGGTPSRFYRAYDIYSISGTEEEGGNEMLIRQDIYKWGPVASAFKVYPDFYEFDAKNEIYEWNGKGEQIGGHAIEIVGWGEEKDKKYWIIKNSWGTQWGNDGYFKMSRGKNDCEIESNIFSVVPDFFYPFNTKIRNELDICKNPELKILRDEIDNNLKIVAGGIDPETGYTRRVMNTFNNIDFKSPIDYKKIIDERHFIAAYINSKKDKKNKNTEKDEKDVNQKNKDTSNFINNYNLIILILITILLFVYYYN
jgi:cathepsin B